MTVGQRINAARKRRRLTLKQLGELADVPMWTLCGWIYQGNHPDILLLCSVADVLEMSIDELIGRKKITEEEKPKE
jgi:transcriptional regulator with XRE-family HTH domain